MRYRHFKQINDTIGHDFGDAVLAKLGGTLGALGNDHNLLIARHGGEEFIAMKALASKAGFDERKPDSST